jgi:CheY-like chemotaxis protein
MRSTLTTDTTRIAIDAPGLRVLVADDDEDTREGLSLAIQSSRADARVRACGSAAEALEALAQAPYDLVITDVRMEDESAGWRVAAAAQKLGTPILLLSGHDGSAEAGRLRDVPLVSKREMLRRDLRELIDCVLASQPRVSAG